MEHLKPWFQIALPVVISINIFFLGFIALIAFAESSLTLEHQRIINVSINTITLGLFTSFLSILFGTFFAVLTTYYDFPLKKIISIALVLPIAFPLYVYAFIFVGGLEYSGSIATWIRSFDIEIGSPRNILSGAIIFSLCVYPYIYLFTKSRLSNISFSIFLASKSLGNSNVKTIFKVILPLVKPAIIAGAILAFFEVIADFGGVTVLQIQTLTTEIYSTWYGLQDFIGGARLSIVLFVIAMAVLILEKVSQNQKSLSLNSADKIIPIKSRYAIFQTILSIVFLLIALVGPLAQLLAWIDISNFLSSLRTAYLANSIVLGIICALIILIVGLLISMGYKLAVSSSLIYQFSLIGYAVPGTVIAVGLMLVVDSFFGMSITLFGITGLIVCLVIRFLPIGYRYFSTALDQIPKNNTHVLALHNLKPWQAFKSGYLGFLKKPFVFGFLFITIECMKEQPATILLRPSGFETLSTQVYNFTTEGQWELAANPSLVLVIISTLLAIILVTESKQNN